MTYFLQHLKVYKLTISKNVPWIGKALEASFLFFLIKGLAWLVFIAFLAS